jgi:hypothetical protein
MHNINFRKLIWVGGGGGGKDERSPRVPNALTPALPVLLLLR